VADVADVEAAAVVVVAAEVAEVIIAVVIVAVVIVVAAIDLAASRNKIPLKFFRKACPACIPAGLLLLERHKGHQESIEISDEKDVELFEKEGYHASNRSCYVFEGE
jgi:hypothetical protein